MAIESVPTVFSFKPAFLTLYSLATRMRQHCLQQHYDSIDIQSLASEFRHSRALYTASVDNAS